MKIRIKGNSLRIRLSRSEVDKLAAEGYLEEKTEFDEGSFGYALQKKEGINNLDAGFKNNTMTMYVPESIASVWAQNEVVGYEHTVKRSNGNTLFLLLEKDFKCIDADIKEDQSDNYENPLLSCK